MDYRPWFLAGKLAFDQVCGHGHLHNTECLPVRGLDLNPPAVRQIPTSGAWPSFPAYAPSRSGGY